MISPEQVRQMIEAGIPGCEARVRGDDGTHFEAVVISDEFRDKPTVQQHQLVYKALGARMGTEIHALSMQTYTRDQWENTGNASGKEY